MMVVDTASSVLPAPPGWPAQPDEAVWNGLAGEIAQAVAPHTEADPMAILGQLLVGIGALVGQKAWQVIERTRHHPNEFLLLVGETCSGKGSSWSQVKRLLIGVDPRFDVIIDDVCADTQGCDLRF